MKAIIAGLVAGTVAGAVYVHAHITLYAADSLLHAISGALK